MDIIKIIAQPYVIEILNELKKPRRYKELKSVCKNDRTLTKRLKMLKGMGFIEIIPIKNEEDKFLNSYRITKKGKELLNEVKKLKTWES
jgi:DNA-binding HxlR family transcriptional regulator